MARTAFRAPSGLSATALCLLALLGLGAATAAGRARGRTGVGTTIVTVTAGKPTELAFRLSRSGRLPAGPITFDVTNAGKLAHSFEICLAPIGRSAVDTCPGRATRLLRAGQSASLTVTFSDAGTYEFLSTVPGQARRGMKGTFTVVASSAPASNESSTSTTTTATGAWGGTGACASPQATTVNITAFDYGFTLSQNPVPCGPITFVQTNTGRVPHNFDINGNAVAIYLNNPGQTSSLTLNLAPGRYRYMCDITGHDTLGMIGVLVVTG